MSIDVKYRVKEVAADFGVTPKEIAEIISKYYEKPKSNTQALTVDELNVVFEHLSQTRQIASLEQVFAVQPKPVEKKTEAPKWGTKEWIAAYPWSKMDRKRRRRVLAVLPREFSELVAQDAGQIFADRRGDAGPMEPFSALENSIPIKICSIFYVIIFQ